MAYAFNPIADPIGFIFYMFLWGIGQDTIGTLLKLSILSSVIVFPFILLGKRVYGWVEKNVKSSRLVLLFLTSFLTLFLFLVIARLWYVAFGSAFISAGLVEFIIDFVIAGIAVFVLALLGDFLSHKLHQKWDVPQKLSLYVVDLIVCFAFFLVCAIVYMMVPW
jgi:hypothetical protein